MIPPAGYHLLIDAHGPTPTTWAVRAYLHEMSNLLEMQRISPVLGIETEDGGVMGMVIIAESHISVHFWPPDIYFIDIFSCRLFDIGEAAEYTTQRLMLRDVETRLINRGEVPTHAIA